MNTIILAYSESSQTFIESVALEYSLDLNLIPFSLFNPFDIVQIQYGILVCMEFPCKSEVVCAFAK